MAILKVRGMITQVHVGQKSWMGEKKFDENQKPIMEHFIKVLDLESEDTDIFKIKFSPDRLEEVKKLEKKNVEVTAVVGIYNKFNFYNLDTLKAQ